MLSVWTYHVQGCWWWACLQADAALLKEGVQGGPHSCCHCSTAIAMLKWCRRSSSGHAGYNDLVAVPGRQSVNSSWALTKDTAQQAQAYMLRLLFIQRKGLLRKAAGEHRHSGTRPSGMCTTHCAAW